MLSKIKRPITILIIWFLAGLGLLCTYWEWDWEVLAGIATWVLAGGVGAAFWQIREARRSTNAQLAVSLFQELRTPEGVEKLRSIYNLPYDLSTCEGVRELKGHEKKGIDYVIDRFETLGVLVAEGIIDDRVAIEGYAGRSALRCWYLLHQYIKQGREERGYFGYNYEGFARLCLVYFYKAGIEVKLYRIGRETKELVFDELQKGGFKPKSFEGIERDRKNRKMTR